MYKQINQLFPNITDKVTFNREMHHYNTSTHSAHTIYTRTKTMASNTLILDQNFGLFIRYYNTTPTVVTYKKLLK